MEEHKQYLISYCVVLSRRSAHKWQLLEGSNKVRVTLTLREILGELLSLQMVPILARTFKASFHFYLAGWLLLNIMFFSLTLGVHKNSTLKILVLNC